MLGPLAIQRGGVTLPLPASRKVRALFAYLALRPRAVARSQLCELLWDVPNDPRGELRWCLSKIRRLLDEPGRRRVSDAEATRVRLDLARLLRRRARDRARSTHGIASFAAIGCASSPRCSPATCSRASRSTAARRSPAGSRRSGAASAAATRRCWSISSTAAPDDEALDYLEKWLRAGALRPARARAAARRAGAAQPHPRGRGAPGRDVRPFEAEGLDSAPIRDAWRAARAQGTPRRSAGACCARAHAGLTRRA